MSKREQILSAIHDALNSPEKPAGVPFCERLRTVALASEQLPAIVLYPVSDKVERVHRGPAAVRTLSFRVECKNADFVDGVPVDKSLDEMLSWCTASLASRSFAGSHEVVEEQTTWVVEAKDYVYCTAAVDFHVSYTTTNNAI